MNALYPGGPSDAELKAIRAKADADSRAIHERWAKEDEERERKEREARYAADAAKRKEEADARAEAELAEVTALVGDPVALVRMVLALKAENAAIKAALAGGVAPRATDGLFGLGVLANGSMKAPELGLPPEPQRNRSGWVG
jgi:hypothetical protein